MQIRRNHVYQFEPNERVHDEYPEVARYGVTVVQPTSYDHVRRQWWVKCNGYTARVNPSCLTADLGLAPKPLGRVQRVILETCLTGANQSMIKTTLTGAGMLTPCRNSNSWLTSYVYPLLRFADKPTPADDDCRPGAGGRKWLRHGYLTRSRGANGLYVYVTTTLGRAMLESR